jgi:hypothetical protein
MTVGKVEDRQVQALLGRVSEQSEDISDQGSGSVSFRIEVD